MADNKLTFELVTPEALLFSEEVEMVVVPGSQGDFGVLPEHSPLVSMLRPGVVSIYQDHKVKEQLFVSTGYADVSGNQCTILAEEAVNLKEVTWDTIDARLEAAENALKKARSELARKKAEASIEATKFLRSIISPKH